MKEELLAYIQEEFLTEDYDPIDEDTNLWEQGLIDSFSVEAIKAFMEAMYDIEISKTEVVPENFQSINKMCALIERIKNE